MTHRLVLCTLLASMFACDGSSKAQTGGAAEPEKAVRAFAAALERSDVPAMQRLMVSADRIRKALDCPGAENLTNDVAQAHQALRELAKAKSELGGVEFQVEAVTEEGRVTAARGDTFHGCTTKEALEARTYKVELRATGVGSGEERQEVIRLDGAWWLLPAS